MTAKKSTTTKSFTVLGDRADAVRKAWREGKRKITVQGHNLTLAQAPKFKNKILVKDALGGVGLIDKKAETPNEILSRIWPDEQD